MSEEKKHAMLSRRSFLATTAVAGTAVATSGMQAMAVGAEREAAPKEETKVTFCRGNCGAQNCIFDVKVREGKVVSMLPTIFPDADPEDKGRSRGCLRGVSMMQTLYNEKRVKYPLRRKEGTARGAGEWERISWDEALDEIATKWSGYIEQFGAPSIIFWAGAGSTVAIHSSFAAWSRLVSLLGLSKMTWGWDQAENWTSEILFNSLQTGCDAVSMGEYSRNIIMWGANPAECSPHEFRYVMNAHERGAKLIAIDPRVTPTTTKSDQHIRPRMGSDAAFGMAVAKYLIENDMIDWEFQRNSATTPFLVKKSDGKFLRGSDFGREPIPTGGIHGWTYVPFTDDPAYVWDKAQNKAVPVDEAQDIEFFGTYTVDVNGQPMECTTVLSLLQDRVEEWDLARAAKVCDVSEQEIIDVANAFYDSPTIMMAALGMDHTTYSHTIFTALLACTVLTGNFLKPGCGWGFQGTTATMGWIPLFSPYYYPTDTPPAGNNYAMVKFPEIMETGKYAGEDVVVKSIIFVAGNAIANCTDRQAKLRALDKVEFLICADPIMTDTAVYCDLVLPVAQWLEEEDTGIGMYTPYIPYGEKCVEPTFEHKDDFDISREIGIRMGLADRFTETFEEVMDQVISTAVGCERPDGSRITRERLQKEKTIRVLEDGYYDASFNLQDGRISFYLEDPLTCQLGNYGEPVDVEKEHLPYFEPPVEAWPEDVPGYPANPLAKQYPLIFMQTHSRYRTHTTVGYNPWILELQEGPVLHMNAIDADARNLKNGDIVKVFNDRGFCAVKLRIDNALKPGTVDFPHGWQQDQFIAGHYQDLTPSHTHPWDVNDNYYDCLCEVVKYEEA